MAEVRSTQMVVEMMRSPRTTLRTSQMTVELLRSDRMDTRTTRGALYLGSEPPLGYKDGTLWLTGR